MPNVQSSSPQTSNHWCRFERTCCVIAILLKLFYLWSHWNVISGFDRIDHLYRVATLRWWDEPGVNQEFYAYHPPVGFAVARELVHVGLPAAAAVQVLTTISALVCFLALRGALGALGLLWTRPGCVFLYGAAAMPIFIHSGASINHDIMIAAICAWTIYVAAKMSGGLKPSGVVLTHVLPVVTVLALALGMLIKYSALYACALLPFSVFVFCKGGWRGRFWEASKAGVLALTSLAIVSPYYYLRYYREEGVILAFNYGAFEDELRVAHAARDDDPLKFFADLTAPAWAQPPREVTDRDVKTIRLSDTWRDFWRMDSQLPFLDEGATDEGKSLASVCRDCGMWYCNFAWFACIAGAIAWGSRRPYRLPSEWDRMGVIVCTFSLGLLALMVRFIWQYPLPFTVPGKALYILPAAWGLAWLISELSLFAPTQRADTWWKVGLLAWLCANHLIPVY